MSKIFRFNVLSFYNFPSENNTDVCFDETAILFINMSRKEVLIQVFSRINFVLLIYIDT